MRCWALADSKTHLGVSSHLMNDSAAGVGINTRSVCWFVHSPEHVGGVRRAGAICWAGNPIKSPLPHTCTNTCVHTHTHTRALTRYSLRWHTLANTHTGYLHYVFTDTHQLTQSKFHNCVLYLHPQHRLYLCCKRPAITHCSPVSYQLERCKAAARLFTPP